MASNASTPSSVLNAPTSTPVIISDQSGLSRRERRRAFRYVDKSGPVDQVKVGFGSAFIRKANQLPATNTPFTWDDLDAAAAAHRALGHTVGEEQKNLAARVKSLVTFGAGRKAVAR
jgi:hypothetical protein